MSEEPTFLGRAIWELSFRAWVQDIEHRTAKEVQVYRVRVQVWNGLGQYERGGRLTLLQEKLNRLSWALRRPLLRNPRISPTMTLLAEDWTNQST